MGDTAPEYLNGPLSISYVTGNGTGINVYRAVETVDSAAVAAYHGNGSLVWFGYDYYYGKDYYDWNLVLYHFMPGDTLPKHVTSTCSTNSTYIIGASLDDVVYDSNNMTDEMEYLRDILVNGDIDEFEDGFVYDGNNSKNDSLYIAFDQAVGVASVAFGAQIRLKNKKYGLDSVSSFDVYKMQREMYDLVNIDLEYTNDYGDSWIVAMEKIQFKWKFIKNRYSSSNNEYLSNNTIKSVIEWNPLVTSRAAQYWRLSITLDTNELSNNPEYDELTIEFSISEIEFACKYYGAPIVFASENVDIYTDYDNVVDSLNLLDLHSKVYGLAYNDLMTFGNTDYFPQPLLSSSSAFVIPQQWVSLEDDGYMSSDAVSNLQAWVSNGGIYICFANGEYTDMNDLETIFGISWSIETDYLDNSESISSVKAKGSLNTVYERCPKRLMHQTSSISAISGVNDSEIIYSPIDDGTLATVARAEYGNGYVVMLGWDWEEGTSFDWDSILWYSINGPYYKTSSVLRDLYEMEPFYYYPQNNDSSLIVYASIYETNAYYYLTSDYYPRNCFPASDVSSASALLDSDDFTSMCKQIAENMGLDDDYPNLCNVSSVNNYDGSLSTSCSAGNYSAMFSISISDDNDGVIWVNPEYFSWDPFDYTSGDSEDLDCYLAQDDRITIVSYACEEWGNFQESMSFLNNNNVSAKIHILYEDDFVDWQSLINLKTSLDDLGYNGNYEFARISYLGNNITNYPQFSTLIIPSMMRSEMYDYLTQSSNNMSAEIKAFVASGGNFVILGDGYGLAADLLNELFDTSWTYENNYGYDSAECTNVAWTASPFVSSDSSVYASYMTYYLTNVDDQDAQYADTTFSNYMCVTHTAYFSGNVIYFGYDWNSGKADDTGSWNTLLDASINAVRNDIWIFADPDYFDDGSSLSNLQSMVDYIASDGTVDAYTVATSTDEIIMKMYNHDIKRIIVPSQSGVYDLINQLNSDEISLTIIREWVENGGVLALAGDPFGRALRLLSFTFDLDWEYDTRREMIDWYALNTETVDADISFNQYDDVPEVLLHWYNCYPATYAPGVSQIFGTSVLYSSYGNGHVTFIGFDFSDITDIDQDTLEDWSTIVRLSLYWFQSLNNSDSEIDFDNDRRRMAQRRMNEDEDDSDGAAICADGERYTASQAEDPRGTNQVSARYSTLTDGEANLFDNDGTYGSIADTNAYILASFDDTVIVNSVEIGGGNVTDWGAVEYISHDCYLQYTNDDTLDEFSWITIMQIEHPEKDTLYRYDLPYTVEAKYFRLFTPYGYLGTTELAFYCNRTENGTDASETTEIYNSTDDICVYGVGQTDDDNSYVDLTSIVNFTGQYVWVDNSSFWRFGFWYMWGSEYDGITQKYIILQEYYSVTENITLSSPTSSPSISAGPPGTMTPGTMTPGTMTPGTMTPGTMTPGTMTPGTMTPGTMPPGTGTMTPGTMTPGTMPPGTMPPGGPPGGRRLLQSGGTGSGTDTGSGPTTTVTITRWYDVNRWIICPFDAATNATECMDNMVASCNFSDSFVYFNNSNTTAYVDPVSCTNWTVLNSDSLGVDSIDVILSYTCPTCDEQAAYYAIEADDDGSVVSIGSDLNGNLLLDRNLNDWDDGWYIMLPLWDGANVSYDEYYSMTFEFENVIDIYSIVIGGYVAIDSNAFANASQIAITLPICVEYAFHLNTTWYTVNTDINVTLTSNFSSMQEGNLTIVEFKTVINPDILINAEYLRIIVSTIEMEFDDIYVLSITEFWTSCALINSKINLFGDTRFMNSDTITNVVSSNLTLSTQEEDVNILNLDQFIFLSPIDPFGESNFVSDQLILPASIYGDLNEVSDLFISNLVEWINVTEGRIVFLGDPNGDSIDLINKIFDKSWSVISTKIKNTLTASAVKDDYALGTVFGFETSQITWDNNENVYFLSGVDAQDRMYVDSVSESYTLIAHFEAYNGKIVYIGYDFSDVNYTNKSQLFSYFGQIGITAQIREYEDLDQNDTIYVSYNGLDSDDCGNYFSPCQTLRQALQNSAKYSEYNGVIEILYYDETWCSTRTINTSVTIRLNATSNSSVNTATLYDGSCDVSLIVADDATLTLDGNGYTIEDWLFTGNWFISAKNLKVVNIKFYNIASNEQDFAPFTCSLVHADTVNVNDPCMFTFVDVVFEQSEGLIMIGSYDGDAYPISLNATNLIVYNNSNFDEMFSFVAVDVQLHNCIFELNSMAGGNMLAFYEYSSEINNLQKVVIENSEFVNNGNEQQLKGSIYIGTSIKSYINNCTFEQTSLFILTPTVAIFHEGDEINLQDITVYGFYAAVRIADFFIGGFLMNYQSSSVVNMNNFYGKGSDIAIYNRGTIYLSNVEIETRFDYTSYDFGEYNAIIYNEFSGNVDINHCNFLNIVNTIVIRNYGSVTAKNSLISHGNYSFSQDLDPTEDIGITNDAEASITFTNVTIEYFDIGIVNFGTLELYDSYFISNILSIESKFNDGLTSAYPSVTINTTTFTAPVTSWYDYRVSQSGNILSYTKPEFINANDTTSLVITKGSLLLIMHKKTFSNKLPVIYKTNVSFILLFLTLVANYPSN